MLFSRILIVILGMASMVIISRGLGPLGQGEYSLAMLIANILFIVFNIGLPSSLIFFVGKYGLEKVSISIALLYFLASLFGALLYALSVLFLREVFFDGFLNNILLLCGLIFLAKMLASYYQGVFLAQEHTLRFNLSVIIQHSSFIVLVCFLSVFPCYFNVVNIFFSFFLSVVLSIIYSWAVLKFSYSRIYFGFEIKQVFKYGLNSHFNNVVAFLIYRTDLVVINYFLGVEAVGLYAVGILIVENMLLFSTTAGMTLLSRLVNQESIEIKLVTNVCKFVTAVTLFFSVVIYFLSGQMIEVIFGEKFGGSVLPLQILLIGVVFSAQSKILANYFAASNQLRVNSYIAIILFLANFILNLLLVPFWGLSGAAMATVFVQLINFILKNLIFSRENSLHFFEVMFVGVSDLDWLRLLLNRILK